MAEVSLRYGETYIASDREFSMPDNHGKAVKVLPGPGPWVRVLIVQRPDGNYAIRPERWLEEVYEGRVIFSGWIPADDRFGIFASADLAEKEASIY